MIQTLVQAWLVKKMMALPMWLLMALGAVMVAKWVRGRRKGTV
ncbi:MAG: hypothetical protein PWR29_1056 [Methanolobus sp.]|jgi:hypothetical protein|nr:hypothetical protein [Methanolobus sp.]MDK2834891.1 hypothetical protein [Methanolobus sp.]MDK2912099.1 hypothetical protein [Methanolobus sp.]MDN5310975.1 hypothetical protein [Methanolobus sp.]